MFKAVNTTDESEIIILDLEWAGALDSLRALDRLDKLICQECRQPVRVRAGQVYRHHFAHKHRENCSLESESPELLNARAVLYGLLRVVYGSNVTIEKQVDVPALRRPVDCWVEDDGRVIAYWIFDKGVREREQLMTGLLKTGAVVHWMFTAQMLRESNDFANGVILTTTERDALAHTSPDDRFLGGSGSLQYLDADAHIMTTYRTVHPIHDPNLYRGTRLQHPLSEVQVFRETGSLLHPGEEARLQAWRTQRAIQKQQEEASRRAPTTFAHPVPPAVVPQDEIRLVSRDVYTPGPSLLSREGTCIHCGQVTRDWWSFDGKTGTCQCNNCEKARRRAIAVFHVPLALDPNDVLVYANEAAIGIDYRCPACGESIGLQAGDDGTSLFVHRTNTACKEEAVLYQTAKRLIPQTVKEWKSGTMGAPVIVRMCRVCNTSFTIPLTKAVDQVILDDQLVDDSPVDISLVTGGKVIAIVQIQTDEPADVSHAQRLGVPYLVLAGNDLVADPTRWRAITHSRCTCPECAGRKDDHAATRVE